MKPTTGLFGRLLTAVGVGRIGARVPRAFGVLIVNVACFESDNLREEAGTLINVSQKSTLPIEVAVFLVAFTSHMLASKMSDEERARFLGDILQHVQSEFDKKFGAGAGSEFVKVLRDRTPVYNATATIQTVQDQPRETALIWQASLAFRQHGAVHGVAWQQVRSEIQEKILWATAVRLYRAAKALSATDSYKWLLEDMSATGTDEKDAREPRTFGILIGDVALAEARRFKERWQERLKPVALVQLQIELAVLMICVTDRLASLKFSVSDRVPFMTALIAHAREQTASKWPSLKEGIGERFDEILSLRMDDYERATSIMGDEAPTQSVLWIGTLMLTDLYYAREPGEKLSSDVLLETGKQLTQMLLGLITTPSYKYLEGE